MKMTARILPCVMPFIATFALGACEDDTDPDEAHLMFVNPPPKALVTATPVDVSWMVHTEGELHITELRACKGHSDDCGSEGVDSFDANFTSTKTATGYTASLTLEEAGPWTVVVFAHVGKTPHISEAIHAQVSAP